MERTVNYIIAFYFDEIFNGYATEYADGTVKYLDEALHLLLIDL